MASDVLLAAVMGAQGLKGEVRVKTFTHTPDAIRAYGTLHTRSGQRYQITACRTAKPGEAVIAFQGVTTREAAEALRGTELFVTRDALPQTAEDEFYHADLVGLEAQDSEGRMLGKVAAIHNYGAGDVIDILRSDGDTVLLAFTRDTVPVIDIAGGRIVVALPNEIEGEDDAKSDPHPNVE